MRKVPSLLICALTVILASTAAAQWGSGWVIPAGAADLKSPVTATPPVLATGKTAFEANCLRCHGAEGKGDGPESDPRSPAADLTDIFRADLNPDGVMYHRILSGKPPVMPAFKDQLTTDQVWAVVEYAKSLRKP